MVLYKRNAQGKPIFWSIRDIGSNTIEVKYGIVGKEGHVETYNTHRSVNDQIKSDINAKRKEGYKELKDLYDNSPLTLPDDKIYRNLYNYLDTYLPKFNTHDNGNFIPMLCKTLEDNKPFTKGTYFGQWKINGERCIITASKTNDLFSDVVLHYRSREGVDWTPKLTYLTDIILPCIPSNILEMMIEEGVGLDGELYIPGYGINEINSFIKNTELRQHYQLQFWCYDLCVEAMSADARSVILNNSFYNHIKRVNNTNDHFMNTQQFVVLPNEYVADINKAIEIRDKYISLGFEGLVIREGSADYQFGGRRNNSMLKFKRKEDGKFLILDIIPEGVKRSHLPKFVCKNDINEAIFECTINKPQSEQAQILIDKNKYIGNYLLVEFRERSGVQQVPFHAKGIKICTV